MANKQSDCELVGTLRTVLFTTFEKHQSDMFNSSFYRRNIQLLQEKGYLIIKGDKLIILEAGHRLLAECSEPKQEL